MVPALVQSVKEAGLVVVAHMTSAVHESTFAGVGIDGFLRNEGVLRFEETIDM